MLHKVTRTKLYNMHTSSKNESEQIKKNNINSVMHVVDCML